MLNYEPKQEGWIVTSLDPRMFSCRMTVARVKSKISLKLKRKVGGSENDKLNILKYKGACPVSW